MKKGKHPSQWVAGLIAMAAGIQGVELRKLAASANMRPRTLRRILSGDRGMSLDEASNLCEVLGLRCSLVAQMTMTKTHRRLMAVEMADEPPPQMAATRPEAA